MANTEKIFRNRDERHTILKVEVHKEGSKSTSFQTADTFDLLWATCGTNGLASPGLLILYLCVQEQVNRKFIQSEVELRDIWCAYETLLKLPV